MAGNPGNPSPYKVPDMAAGFGTALTYNFAKNWGAEADFGYNWDSGNYEATVSGGPRFMWRTDDANFFLHTLLSFNRLSVNAAGNPNNGIGAILGGGMDIPITKKFAWRVFEADYVWGHHN